MRGRTKVVTRIGSGTGGAGGGGIAGIAIAAVLAMIAASPLLAQGQDAPTDETPATTSDSGSSNDAGDAAGALGTAGPTGDPVGEPGAPGSADYVTRSEFEELQLQLEALETQVDGMPGQPPLSVTGNVSMAWAADLNTLGTGFRNEGISTIKLTILPSSSRESIARGDVVGHISIDGFRIEANSTDILGSTGSITAGISGKDWDFQIWSLSQLAVGLARVFEAGQTDISMTETRSGGFTYTYGGLDLVDLTVNLGSAAYASGNEANSYLAWFATNWNLVGSLPSDYTLRPGSRNAFVVRLLGGYQADLGNPGVYVDAVPFRSGDFAFALQPILIVPTVGHGLVTSLAADLYSEVDATTNARAWPQMDFRFDTRVNLSEIALIGFTEERSHVAAAAYLSLGDITTSGDEDLDLEVRAVELAGGEGLLPRVTAAGAFQLLDVIGPQTPNWSTEASMDYAFGRVTPYIGAGYTSVDDLLSLNVGVRMGLLPRVLFIIDYESDAINSTDPLVADRGVLQFRTEIGY